MALPWITRSSTAPTTVMPLPVLPEITLSPAAVPSPTIQSSSDGPDAASKRIPSRPLGSAVVAVMSVPIRLPMIRPSSAPLLSGMTRMPASTLPEITLYGPMVTSFACQTKTPHSPLGAATMPVRSVPIRQPSITAPSPSDITTIASSAALARLRPRIVTSSASIVSRSEVQFTGSKLPSIVGPICRFSPSAGRAVFSETGPQPVQS